MSAASGLDHVIIGVADLDEAAALWRRLGFTVTPRGRHIGWGTANYCIMFPDDYVELLGILNPDQYVHGLDGFLREHGEGLLGLAFGTADPHEVFRALRGIGQASAPPKDLARLLDSAEGTVKPRFHLVHPRDARAFGFDAFFCRHLTPDLVRRPAWLSHPNGATGIVEVDLRVPDPRGLAPRYAALFGSSSVTVEGDRLEVKAGATLLKLRVGPVGGERLTIGVGDLPTAGGLIGGAGLTVDENSADDRVSLTTTVNGIEIRFIAV